MLEQVPKGSDHVRNEFVLIKTHPNMFLLIKNIFEHFYVKFELVLTA